MKNINLSFGYDGPTNWEHYTFLLSKYIKILPFFYIRLYRTYYNSDVPFLVNYHSIEFGWLKFFFIWSKRNGKWYFDNLTGK